MSDSDSKGYRLKRKFFDLSYQQPRTPKMEKVQVWCKRCRNTWLEEQLVYPMMGSMSETNRYDVCNKCKTDQDEVEGSLLDKLKQG